MPGKLKFSLFSNYLPLVVLFLVCPVFSIVVPAQDVPFLKLSEQMAVNMAVENNIRIRNSVLETEKAKYAKNSAINIPSATFTYQYGNIHSPLNESYIELNQNFGSLLMHIRRYKTAQSQIALEESKHGLTKKEVIAEVKSAYYFWLYLSKKLEIFLEQKNQFSNMGRIAALKYELGDIDILEKATLLAMQAETEVEYYTLQDDIVIAGNKLKQLLATDQEIAPETTLLELYMIDKPSPHSEYKGGLVLDVCEKTYELELKKFQTEKARFFPGISAGYFNQTIGTVKGLDGWQAGLSFPVWFFSPMSDIRQAKINTQIAQNNLENQRFLIQSNIENLLFELNKLFKMVIHYKEYIIPQAEMLINTAGVQFEKEEIEYSDYLKSISRGYKFFTDYYETINNYNQTAIQLEFYAD
ncbi:MAG: TolC family protein [Bacteroidales bacterium]